MNTAATVPPTIPITPAKYQKLTPAANITAPPAAISITDVPRFGCISTKTVGATIRTTGSNTHSGRETFLSSSQS